MPSIGSVPLQSRQNGHRSSFLFSEQPPTAIDCTRLQKEKESQNPPNFISAHEGEKCTQGEYAALSSSSNLRLGP